MHTLMIYCTYQANSPSTVIKPLAEVFTLLHLFLLESSWNPTIPGRNTRNPGGMTRNFLPANLHSNPQFLVLPSPGGIHLESWQISSPTRIPGRTDQEACHFWWK